MTTKITKATREELTGDQFSWIVGPVLEADIYEGHDLAIVMQASNAYAVVRPSSREYLGCCPTYFRAYSFANSQL